VTSDTAAQFYDVRSPTGETVLLRRRLTTTLGVGAYDLLESPPGDPHAPELSLRARLRYDADYGVSGLSSDPSTAASTSFSSFVPGYPQQLVDLMYAYVEGRRFFHGLLGFKLGRQYQTDALGWWSFDGADVSVTTPYYVKAEVYGGFEQRGGLPLSTSRYEPDGVWRGDRTGFTDPALYTSFQPASVAPAFGAAIESTGVTWIHGRLTYRRVYNTGSSNVSEFESGLYNPAIYDGWRISSERLGYAFDTTWATVGALKGGVVYDFYRSEITHGWAALDGYIGQKVTVGADFDYYVPWFDGDSIWNMFAGQPSSTITARGNVDFTRHLSLSASANARFFTVQTSPFNPCPAGVTPMCTYSPSPNYAPMNGMNVGPTYFPGNPHPADEGGSLSARWRTGETQLGLRGYGNFRDTGDHDVGADVTAEHVFETRYVVRGRAGLWQWNDTLRPDRDATSVNYVLAAGYRFAPRCQAMVDWEHDINRLVGQRFRLLLTLNLAVTK
ncbi:MAG TPA: hypothetical protein VE987_14290, partial [Polyangiaceae bacterium]|nr:hypothetical protein [Polyangiaceae bacterium]